MRFDREKFKKIRRELVINAAFPLFVLAVVLLWIMPKFIRRKVDRFAGRMYYKYGHKARFTALENIKMAYGASLQHGEIEQMAREVFTNTASAFLDFFSFVYVNSKNNYFKYVSVVGEEHLQKAFAKGNGVICLIPHVSSWELSAVTPSMLGYPTVAASKPIKGYLVQRAMVWFRKRRGMINFERDGSYQNLVTNLKDGKCLILMIDQDTKVKSCFVNFFGKPAYTPLGVSRLVADTSAAVVPMSIRQTGIQRYIFEILPEIPSVKTENSASDLIVNTQNQSDIIEKIVRANPTQWVWMHKRWKTRPEGESGIK